jgi:hypothetical protein
MDECLGQEDSNSIGFTDLKKTSKTILIDLNMIVSGWDDAMTR